jgi:pSer/pThr/pTyr-binding forkhead associated (FHA) protein
VTGALEADEALLALKIGFLVLLYLFIWVIVRSATRDLRATPQESIILNPSEAAELRAAAGPQAPAPAASVAPARLVVVSSPSLAAGSSVELTAPTHVGRGAENGMRLDGDEYVSSRHARFEPRPDGLWVEDADSRNGTFVNGSRVTTARLLRAGDVVRIGQTDLEVQE